jgi:hypothetical protein
MKGEGSILGDRDSGEHLDLFGSKEAQRKKYEGS